MRLAGGDGARTRQASGGAGPGGQQGRLKRRVRQADGSTGGGAGRAGGWWPYIQCGGARTGAPGVGEEGSRKVQALLPAVGRSDQDLTADKLEATWPNPWPELGPDFVI